MANKHEDHLVQCPYYKTNTSQVVYCEGLEDGMAIHYAEQQAAISWARSARPIWHAVYYHTKKKRTRKKYLDKIVRDYRQEG